MMLLAQGTDPRLFAAHSFDHMFVPANKRADGGVKEVKCPHSGRRAAMFCPKCGLRQHVVAHSIFVLCVLHHIVRVIHPLKDVMLGMEDESSILLVARSPPRK